MRRLKYLIVFFVLGILGISLIGGLVDASKKDVRISFGVMDKFDESDEVEVIIGVKSSGKEKDLIGKLKNKDKAIKFSSGGFAAKISKAELDELIASGGVDYVEEVRLFNADLSDSVGIINASLVWPLKLDGINITGTGQTVCIIDTGINYSHVDLIGRNMTACNLDCIDKICVENCSESDFNGHGTHVMGIVGAVGNVIGVANNINYIGLKVFPGSSRSGATTIGIKNAIDWCVDNSSAYNISVISMSLGTDTRYGSYCDSLYPSLNQSITNAFNQNISVVVSTGNEGNTSGISSPSCISTAIPVSSTDKSDGIWSGSNRNALVKLMAPGTSIYSTYYTGNYATLTGTSMSAPHVSGAIALIRQYLDFSGLTKTPWEIEDVLNSTGQLIDDSAGSGENYTRINVYEAIISLDGDSPNVSLVSPEDNFEILEFDQTFRCNSSDFALDNVTFYLWNLSSEYNITFEDISGQDNSFEINITGLDYGNYEWNCLYYDVNGNSAFASSNFSLKVTNISVSLNSPSYELITNQNQSYNCSVSSNNELSNLSLYIWNASGDLEFNISEDISGTSNSSLFSYNLSSDGNYSWNCLAITNASSSIFASSNYSIYYDLTSPNISIVTPENSNWYSFGIFNVTLSELGNCWYSLNDGLTNITMTLTGTVDFTASNSTISDGSDYNVTYYCNDSAGNVDSDFSTFNIDSSDPVVSLVNPDDDYSATGTTSIDFQYSVTDNLNITGCSLILDGSNVASNSSQITAGTNTITRSVSVGSYSWYVNCNDEASNSGSSSSRSLTINEESTSSPSGGGTTTVAAKTYVASKELLSTGYSKQLEKDDKIKMTLGILGKDEEHILTVEEVGTDNVKIKIESDPIELTLLVGKLQKVDINSDGIYDLKVKLSAIDDGKATIDVWSIIEEVLFEAAAEDESVEVNESVDSNGVEDSSEEVSKLKNNILIFILVVFVVFVIILALHRGKHKKKNKLIKLAENLFKKYKCGE